MQYTQEVQKELGVEQSGIMMFMAPAIGMMQPAKAEVKGALLYLVTKPEPQFQQIAFKSMDDEKAFRKYVLKEKQKFGGMAELEGKGDKYTVTMKFGSFSFDPKNMPRADEGEGKDPDSPGTARAFVVRVDASAGLGSGSSSSVKMDNGIPTEMKTYYRYHDGIVYEGQFEGLHRIELPKGRTMQPKTEQAAHDLYLDIDLAEIPRPLKEVAWTTLKSQAGTYLQQFENEDNDSYSWRRAFGEGRLEMMKTGIFDIDRVQVEFSAAEADDQPIKLKVKVQARENSELAKQFSQLNSDSSRFAAFADEDSPLFATTSVRLPEWAQEMLAAQIKSFRTRMEIELGSDADSLLAVNDVLAVLDDTVKTSRGDAMVRMIGNAKDGFELQGGLRITDAARLSKSIETLARERSSFDENTFVETDTIDGQQILTLRSNDQLVPLATDGSKMPMILHVATQGGYVWISAGDDDAKDNLVKTIQQATGRQSRSSSSPLNLRFSLKDWIGAKDDAGGDHRIPQLALRKVESFIGDIMPFRAASISVNGEKQTLDSSKEEPLPSYLGKALNPENSFADLKVDTKGRNLEADLKMGTGVVKIAIGQYLAAQKRMFQGMNFSFGGRLKGDNAPKEVESLLKKLEEMSRDGKELDPEEIEKILGKGASGNGGIIIRGGSGGPGLSPEKIKELQKKGGGAVIIRGGNTGGGK